MIKDIDPMRKDLLATQKNISYAYLAGYLEQSLAHIARELVAAELADPMAVWAIQALADSKIEKAHAAAREYSAR